MKSVVWGPPWESEMAFSHWALQVLATKFEFKMAWVHAPRWPGKQYRKRAIIEWKLLNGYSTIKCVILKLKRFRWHDRTLVLMFGPSRNTIYRYQMLLIQYTHNILKWSCTGVSILVLLFCFYSVSTRQHWSQVCSFPGEADRQRAVAVLQPAVRRWLSRVKCWRLLQDKILGATRCL